MVWRHCGAKSSASSCEKISLLLGVMLGIAACGTIEENLEREPNNAQPDAGEHSLDDVLTVDDTTSGGVGDRDVNAGGLDGTSIGPDTGMLPNDVGWDDADGEIIWECGFDTEVDENCHWDCRGGQSCEDGVVWGNAWGAAPCWATPNFEGQDICVVYQSLCASNLCGATGPVCSEEEDWAWPDANDTNAWVNGSLDYARGPVVGLPRLVLAPPAFAPPDTPRFMLSLSDCEAVSVEFPSPQADAFACQMLLEEPGRPAFSSIALARNIRYASNEGLALGSVTWWDGAQLVRVDWYSPDGSDDGGYVRLRWNYGVDAPTLEGVLPPAGEGSGEGSGTPTGGSGEGSGTPVEGSGEGSGTPVEGSGEGSGTPIEGSGATDGSGATP